MKHIVIWTMKEGVSAEQKMEMKARLEALIDPVAELRAIEVGVDEEQGTMVLNSEFDSAADLQAYQVHPEHQAVVALVKSLVSGRVACDYGA